MFPVPFAGWFPSSCLIIPAISSFMSSGYITWVGSTDKIFCLPTSEHVTCSSWKHPYTCVLSGRDWMGTKSSGNLLLLLIK